MGDKSAIEWTDATWNPVTGCTKVSQGCKNCYAERVFPRSYGSERKFTDVRTHPERLDQPLRWKRPRKIFVNSMSDLFHESVPDEFIDRVFAVMAMSPQHTFQILTKRPERLRQYLTTSLPEFWSRDVVDPEDNLDGERKHAIAQTAFEMADNQEELQWSDEEILAILRRWPLPNVWLGVSVEDRKTWLERSEMLKRTPAAIRFISYEPALGPLGEMDLTGIDWIIVGGESGPQARPSHPDWFRSVRDECQAAGVPFFFKQWGEWLPGLTDGAPGDNQYLNCSDQPIRVGKKAAGRLLDLREWNEFPVVST